MVRRRSNNASASPSAKAAATPHHHHHHRARGGALVAQCSVTSPDTPNNNGTKQPHFFGTAKPRIGSQYQTKVPKRKPTADDHDVLFDRPNPDKMSVEYPNCTQEQHEGAMRTIEDPAQVAIMARHAAVSPGYGRVPAQQRRRQGGLCVHRPNSHADSSYLSFAHPLVSCVPPTTHDDDDDDMEMWKQEMIQRHGFHATNSSSGDGAKRRRVRNQKRKRSEDRTNHSFATAVISSSAPLEGDAAVLEHLTVRHDGNAQAAKLAVMVDMSAGRASKARKILQKELYASRFRRPPTTCSQSWIVRLERTYPELLGDLRCDATYRAYPYHCDDENDGSTQDISSLSEKQTWDEDGLKGIWRSILAYGQEMERDLSNGGSRRLMLSDIANFFRRARSLPLPEEAFGTRHLLVEGISDCFHNLLDFSSKARNVQAKLLDLLYDNDNGESGVDMEAVQKYLVEIPTLCNIKLDDEAVVKEQLELYADWKSRLEQLARDQENDDEGDTGAAAASSMEEEGHRDDLAAAELLAMEGVTKLAFRSKDLVLLEKRIEKAHRLADRILARKESIEQGKKETIKSVASLVREANRINLCSPEVTELILFHRAVLEWVERANIAIRSRMSLSEIELLIERANSMPLVLSEFVDKLCSRRDMAIAWIEQLEEVVPRPLQDENSVDSLQWMSCMRHALRSSEKRKLTHLQDLASEGTRIPVEIDSVKMLLSEIDAKNWSVKAKKWVPVVVVSDDGESTTGVKAKLENLRDHLEKGEALREKLTLSSAERETWTLDGEDELWSIVNSAEDWFEKYQTYLQYDSRRSTEEKVCLSVPKLRQIVKEMQTIHANIGSVAKKMARILAQAEAWFEQFFGLLVRCGLLKSDTLDLPASPVTLEEIMSAVSIAEADVSLGLDEAYELKALGDRIQIWTDRVENAAPKRSKRIGKGRYSKTVRYSVSELVGLIDESNHLPIRTDEEIDRLSKQLDRARQWQLEAQKELKDITVGFQELRQAVDLAYGPPKEFYSEESRGNDVGFKACQEEEVSTSNDDGVLTTSVCCETLHAEDNSLTDSASIPGSETDSQSHSKLGSGGSGVHKMISSLLKDARSTAVYTAEEEAAEVLETVARWSLKSISYIDSPRDVYDKKTFIPFDKFVQAGHELLASREQFACEIAAADSTLIPVLTSSWGNAVSDQLVRLQALQAHRNEFIEWSKAAQATISGNEKRATLNEIKKIFDQSDEYPSSSDLVQKVRNLADKASKWTETVKEILESGEKLSFDDAKDMVDDGEKLKFASEELKTLRNALRSARSWAKRVRKSKIDQGGAHVTEVQDLVAEHDALLICMPEDMARLKQAMQGYCICRRPYEGFMIGCDGCEEWYHGPCIGVSESQADRYDKYLCVRCSTKRAFMASATVVALVVRKWSSEKELKKARQVDAQKHQRKVRKEKRDIEKYAEKFESLNRHARKAKEEGAREMSVDPSVVDTVALSTRSEYESVPMSSLLMPPNQSEGDEETVMALTQGSDTMSDACHLENSEEVTHSNVREQPPSQPNGSSPEFSKIREAVQACESRLGVLTVAAEERRKLEGREDEKKDLIRAWGVRVRSLIIVPSTTEQAQKGRPNEDGTLSEPMMNVLRDAEVVGISELPDVIQVENAFYSIAWACHAMSMLAKRPSISDLNSVVSHGSNIKMTDEKAFRMMRAMLNRASQWQIKVEKALAPRPEETRSINVDLLKDLADGADSIPFQMPEKPRLLNVIDDKGNRHCLCGGPHVGSLMVCCDGRCERWYHSHCVGIDKNDSERLENWMCPSCSQIPVDFQQPASLMDFEIVDEESDCESDSFVVPPHAPLPEKLWPPFDLLGSSTALEALGVDCSSIPDDTLPLQFHLSSQHTTNGYTHAVSAPKIATMGEDMKLAPCYLPLQAGLNLSYVGTPIDAHLENMNYLLVPPEVPSTKRVDCEAILQHSSVTEPAPARKIDEEKADEPVPAMIPKSSYGSTEMQNREADAGSADLSKQEISINESHGSELPTVAVPPSVDVPEHSHHTRFKTRVEQSASSEMNVEADPVLVTSESSLDEKNAPTLDELTEHVLSNDNDAHQGNSAVPDSSMRKSGHIDVLEELSLQSKPAADRMLAVQEIQAEANRS